MSVKAPTVLPESVTWSKVCWLSVGAPDEVRAYCERLIDTVGRDGGFILGPSGQTEDVKIENVRTMVDCAKEYGGAA